MNVYYVYIMSNPRWTVLYIGMTGNLLRRVHEHKSHAVRGFTSKYNCTDLVYFEETSDAMTSIEREKQLKKWRREKKLALIYSLNPELRDLSVDL